MYIPFILTIRIRKHECGLWFRHGDFHELLKAGKYRFHGRKRNQVDVYNTLDSKFEHELLDSLILNENVRNALEIVDLNDNQRALVWKDDRIAYILGPGRHAFWKTQAKLKIEVFDIAEQAVFKHDRIEAVLSNALALHFLTGVEVESSEHVLLFRDGELVEELNAGRHFYWKGTGRITWESIDRREQSADVTGQEIMTRDKVTLRVNLLVNYQVVDVVKAATVVSDFAQTLYREAQLVLRAAIGTRNLDALLADKEAVGTEVRKTLAIRALDFGVEVRSVGLKDIILPGDMKMILNQVIEAQKAAEANLIRRREETAAARSQANTAKLLAENPQLARMKELESLAEILAGAKTTFVLGSGNLSDQISRLVRDETANGVSE